MTAGESDQWFAGNLRRERERLGITQAAMAQRMTRAGFPCHQQTIASIESGTRAVRIGEAQQLAALVGSDIETLTRPPAQAGAALRLARLARELREVHAQAQNYARLFLADREELREAIALAAGDEALADAVAQACEVAELRLHWEG